MRSTRELLERRTFVYGGENARARRMGGEKQITKGGLGACKIFGCERNETVFLSAAIMSLRNAPMHP